MSVSRRGDADGDQRESSGSDEPDVVEVAITDELDLHTFLPRDVSSLVPEYLDECARRGFREVRIVHGKGRGVLRRAVYAALDRHPRVASYRQAEEWAGGWGATVVTLTPSS
ncbi:MAG TPA: Smr/MutS family protein [Kofleriaceae bacterium]|nr:Smr/MutS family protein [Kofleriaceae bacterium]